MSTKTFFCLLSFFSVFVSFADTYYWAGGEGAWSDASKWKSKENGNKVGYGYPDGVDDSVAFLVGAPGRINVDGTYNIKSLELRQGSLGVPDTIVLSGEGTLVIGAAGSTSGDLLLVYAYRRLEFRGADVSVWGVQYVFDGAEVVVGEGSVYRPRYHYMIKDGSRLVLDGGEIRSLDGGEGRVQFKNGWNNPAEGGNIAFFDVRSGVFRSELIVDNGTFRMTGGYCAPVNQGTVFSKYADVKVTGGTLALNMLSNYPIENCGVFPDGATLSLGSTSTLKFNALAGNANLPLNGGAVCGNGALAASAHFNITGGGDLTFGRGMSLSSDADDPVCNVVMDVDSLTLGANMSRPNDEALQMYFPREMVFAATNAGWFVSGNNATFWFEKGVTIDTSDRADGVTGRKIHLRRPTFAHDAYLRIVGNGAGVLTMSSAYAGEMLSELSVGGGATNSFELIHNQTVKTRLLSVGSGATLGVIARNIPYVFAEALDFKPGSRLSVGAGSYEGPILPVVCAGPLAVNAFDGGSPETALTSAAQDAGWECRFVHGCLALCKKNATLATPGFDGNRWTGNVDGSFETSGNWSAGRVPEGTNTTAVFDGIQNTSVAFSKEGAELYSLRFLNMAGPFVLRGGPIRMESRVYDTTSACAIYSSSAFPVVISNNLSRSWIGGNHSVIAAYSAGAGYIALAGDVDGYARFEARGDIRILGEAKAWNLKMTTASGSYSAPTRLTLYPGASFLASNQTMSHPGPQNGMEIMENAVLTVRGSKYGYDDYGTRVAQRVDGLFDVQAPLCGTVGHWFVGSGRVKFKDTGSKATADYTIRLGEKVRFSAETFVKPIEVEGEPTLCSENAWEYAAGPLALPKGCVLTIDTQDPDTAEGYDCTFASAISGPGSLKVKGLGSLRLTAENSIGGAVTLDGGTLVVSKAQNFGSLSGGGVLTLDASGGEVPQLNVAGGFDLSVVTLGFNGLTEKASKGWVTLASFPAGSVLPALPGVLSDHWKVRYVQGENGLRLLQARYRTGIEIIVR